MFTAMISPRHVLVVFLGLALALGVSWAAIEWRQDHLADTSGATKAPASEQAAAGGQTESSTVGASATPDRVASRAGRSAEAPESQPAAQPQQRQPVIEPAPRLDTPEAASGAPEPAVRDRAAPAPSEAVTASREPTPAEPPASQPERQVEAPTSPDEPQSRTAEAAPPASPAIAQPTQPADEGVTESAAKDPTAATVPSGATEHAKEGAEGAAPETPAASNPAGAAPPQPPLAPPGKAVAERRKPEGPAEPADSDKTIALAEPAPAGPKAEPVPATPKAEPAPGPPSEVQATPEEPLPQQAARSQERDRLDEPRSAPARAAETIRRALSSLFGGAMDTPVPPKSEAPPKTKESEVAAVPDTGGVPPPDRGSAPADVEPGAAPTFDIVRIEPRGRAVMAGRAAPGAEVEIRSGDRLIDRARADQRGEWVVVPEEPLTRGVQELRLSARLDDRPAVESAEVLVVAIPDPPPPEPALRLPDDVVPQVAAAPPAEQAFAVALPREGPGKGRILQAPGRISGEGALALVMVDYDDAGRIRLSGEGTAGSALRIYVNNEPAGVTMVGPSGRWDAVLERALSPGNYTLRLDQLGASGKPDARLETPFTRVGHPPVAGDVEVDYVIVQPGNSLWRIARRVFGEGLRYIHIYEANQAQIRNPDLIYPGQVFEIPSGIGTAG
jgi:nucleoid-associated protein YgaU